MSAIDTAFVAIQFWCDDPEGTDADLRKILEALTASVCTSLRSEMTSLSDKLMAARNEALEEAADSATKFLVGDPFNGVPLRSPGPHEVAAHILTLKTKD